MQNTKGLSLEIRLSAYLDGEVTDAEHRELEELVARDEEARRLFEQLQAGNAFGNKAFEDFLHDPVPLSLVRRIKQGTPTNPKAERVTTADPIRHRTRLWPRTLAASVVLLLVGGSTGYILGMVNSQSEQNQQVAAARSWLDDIAEYHRVYSRQETHLVEVPASQGDAAIINWLASSVGVNFNRPDLAAQGLTFEGGRLLVAAGKPVAQLMYRNAEGDVFAICFLKSESKGEQGKLAESMRDDLAMVSWQKSGASYVVIGPSADAKLRDLAETVATEI
ncbi:anti-sigma factor [Rhizobium sp. 32-5/1]|uniref:anti-sigma factor family protein n=1 Tax=Rhizobium sp. 32-5/1 TaxID=3019602 RepID=UPI00240E6B7E|nr:anti-sigma factor [Rhizobium sp. 32-5/1]WEZ82915.1 anti-sigma factor [Rhizobium sp. 32-5/1]